MGGRGGGGCGRKGRMVGGKTFNVLLPETTTSVSEVQYKETGVNLSHAHVTFLD